MGTTHFDTLSAARAHMSDLTDAAASGRVATYNRGAQRIAAVDVTRLRDALTKLHPANAEVIAEDGVVGLFMREPALAVEANTFHEAVADMVTALREYALDWDDHLRLAPNHADNWGVVQIVTLSDDEQLTAWITGTGVR